MLILAGTFYYSSLFAIGLLIGFLVTTLICRKFNINEYSGKQIFVDFGNWKLHLHHWIMGLLLVGLILLGGWRPEIPAFVWGLIAGMIAEDFYNYSDWHEILVKNG